MSNYRAILKTTTDQHKDLWGLYYYTVNSTGHFVYVFFKCFKLSFSHQLDVLVVSDQESDSQ